MRAERAGAGAEKASVIGRCSAHASLERLRDAGRQDPRAPPDHPGRDRGSPHYRSRVSGPQSNPHRDAGPIVGIDLGTTNSLVAIADERGPRVLLDEQGRALLPSVVRYEFSEQGPGVAAGDASTRRIVGHEAREQAVLFPRSTVSSVKRLMGRSVKDAAADLKYLSYDVVEGEHATARVRIEAPDGDPSRALTLSPQEVSAAILARLRAIAESALRTPVRRAVVTVPAYFDDAQRQATRDAGAIAGLEVVRIVNEPTAAALAYGLSLDRAAMRNAAEKSGASTIAVYDLGGGTFDVSILRLTPMPASPAASGGAPSTTSPAARDAFQVLSTSGDTHLGGDDIDHALVALFSREIAAQLGGPAGNRGTLDLPPPTRKQLVQLAEQVKIRLSERDSASIRIDLGGSDAYERTITKAELEAMISPLVDRTIDACRRALRDAGLARHDATPIPPSEKNQRGVAGVGVVVMVGGSTRIPLVRKRVGEFFGLEPYTALDPDQVVALGAAVQASVLSGANKSALLLDVIPLSLGIETRGGAVAKLIVRNSSVPARATEMFSTSVDGQTSIKLNVLQGEREMASDCRSLGTFHLSGIPPMPAGIPQLEVTFAVDANGVLSVSAYERRSGKRASLQVVPNHGLTREEVDRIERDSFTHAREDMRRHRVVDLITNSRLDLKWIGEGLAKHGALLDASDRAALEAKIATLRTFVEQGEKEWDRVDPDAFHRAKEDLDRASVRLQEVSIAASLRGDKTR